MQHTDVPFQMGAPCAQTGTQSYKQRMCHHDAPFCRHDSGKWGITPEAVRQGQACPASVAPYQASYQDYYVTGN